MLNSIHNERILDLKRGAESFKFPFWWIILGRVTKKPELCLGPYSFFGTMLGKFLCAFPDPSTPLRLRRATCHSAWRSVGFATSECEGEGGRTPSSLRLRLRQTNSQMTAQSGRPILNSGRNNSS